MSLLLTGAIASGMMWAGYSFLRLTAEYVELNPPRQPAFDADRYLGRWYEFRRESDIPFEKGICCSVFYQYKPDGKQIDVQNSEFRPPDSSHLDPYWVTFYGVAQASTWNPGQLRVSFFPLAPWGDYNVVATDYDTYVIVYSGDYNLPKALPSQALWVLTREKIKIGTPEHDAMDKLTRPIIEQLLPRYSFENSIFATQDNELCPSPPWD